MKWLLVLMLATASALAAAQAPDPADALAMDYLRLTLAMGAHDKDYVDAYYGPPELRAQVLGQKLALVDIQGRALALQAALARVPAPAPDSIQAMRLRYLHKQTVAMLARIDFLQGRKRDFDAESALLYDTVAPHRERAHFEKLVSRIDALLPGEGSTAERVNAFRAQFVIPRDKLKPVFEAAIAGCRERTLRHLALPAGESFELEFVTDKPWSGYNWYKGDYHSLIQINVELPIYIERAIDVGCHEGYPGHHAYNALLEQHLVRGRKWPEFSAYALFSPQSLIAEGSANYGVDMAFPEAERKAFLREVLYPLAGLDPAQLDKYEALQELMAELTYAGNEAARGYLDGRMSREQAIAWQVELELATPERAAQRTRFFDSYRSYVINYNVGKQLVKDYVERRSAGAASEAERSALRWQVFGELLSSPRLPGDLREAQACPTTSVFAPGVVSNAGLWEWRLSFAPSKREAFWATSRGFWPATREQSPIVGSELREGAWSPPAVVSFSGKWADFDPFVSPDGNTMFFSSMRPLDGAAKKDMDLWRVRRSANGWGEPEHLGDGVNAAGQDELYASVDARGTLYFARVQAPVPSGDVDIWRSELQSDGSYGPPVKLGAGVNSPQRWEFNPEISPDGATLVFTRLDKPGDAAPAIGHGLGDLYYATRGADGEFATASNLGPCINTAADEYHPSVDWQNNILYFARADGAPSNFHMTPLQLTGTGRVDHGDGERDPAARSED